MGLAGKICLVTGGARGIGRATAVEMARQEAEAVLVCDLDDESGEETRDLLTAAGTTSVYYRCDVSRTAEVQAMMDSVQSGFGRLDVLHNNAAIVDAQVTEQARLDLIEEEAWDQVFATNVRGTWLCIKYAFPMLRNSGSAAIVNCASISSFTAFEGESCYCASKGSIPMLTRSAALDFAPFGVRCNCYCPGTIKTEMVERQVAALGAESQKLLKGIHLTKEPRFGEPEEVARLVCFLASDAASFINGASYLVDGGALAWRGS